jgi:Mg2+ and Co2+ transporter CorA
MWRRLIPLYREMVSETLLQVFRFPCHTEAFSSTAPNNNLVQDHMAANHEETQKPRLGSIKAYQNDFVLALSYLEESQKRIDRLTAVVTAVMKIEDTRRSLRDARNIGRLTWLATFFIPFSLIATMFAMQPKLEDIYPHTVRIYLATSVPLAVVTVFIAWVLSHPSVQKRFHVAKGRATKAVTSS